MRITSDDQIAGLPPDDVHTDREPIRGGLEPVPGPVRAISKASREVAARLARTIFERNRADGKIFAVDGADTREPDEILISQGELEAYLMVAAESGRTAHLVHRKAPRR
jgi:hypothetical protein